MGYHISKALDVPFDEAVKKVSIAFEEKGFSILTDTSMEFRDYRIPCTYDPRFAHLAVTVQDWVGLMLPCSVMIQKRFSGEVEVAAVDPVASMKAVENPQLLKMAEEVGKRLRSVIGSL
jgi:uncharacterized protein (DUF302 family)